MVEKRKTLGGTCLNIGCIPSKALLHASEMFEEAGHGLGALGVVVAPPKLDLAAMMKHKDDTVAANVNGVAFLFKKNKIDWLQGEGRIAAPGRVVVAAEGGGGDDLRGEGDRHRHRLRRRPAAGDRDRRKPDRLLDRRAVAGEAAEVADRRRRGGDRARTRLGVAPARRRGDGGRIPRPHPARHGRRGRQADAAAAGEAGHQVPPVAQGRRGREAGQGRQGDDRAGRRRRAADARGRGRAGGDRPAALHARARPRSARRRDGARPGDDRRPFRHQRADRLRDRRRRARADARPQGRGRGRWRWPKSSPARRAT